MMGGTGDKFTIATTVVAGLASLAATLMSTLTIWLHAKNYRKPIQQRYVVRILMMVPIYSIASWTSMVSLRASQFVDPIRDIYEAFTIYTFFQLLINYLSGERALIVMMHGRAPVSHLWPLNHVLPQVDISDPHTFLAIKRGILQYAWLKPVLSLAAIIMRPLGVYKEGYIGLDSGYLWTGLFYNLSVTVSLYSLGLFWVCMSTDLKPFRPVPKFLCVKLIIFASYWQGFFLSILVWLGAIPDQGNGYSPDNVASAIQDALICIEMPIFAVYHWHAFSWRDFASPPGRNTARMQVKYAFRDAFGCRDLIEDTKMTLRGENYGYRIFDSGDKIMAHEDSRSRLARLKDGMRYERGGKGKYWIPKPGEATDRTPLLGQEAGSSSRADTLPSRVDTETFDENALDADIECLYDKARELEFGDWNYPVVSSTESLSQRYLSSREGLSLSSPSPRQSLSSSNLPPVVIRKTKKHKPKSKHAKPSAEPSDSAALATSSTNPSDLVNDPSISSVNGHPSSPVSPQNPPPAKAAIHTVSDEEAHRQSEQVSTPVYSTGDDEPGNVWGEVN